MRSIHRILVVIEPRQMRQVALDRAMAFIQATTHSGVKREVNVVAVMPVYDESWDLTSRLSIEKEEDIKNDLVKKHERWLDNYLAIHAMGYNIERKVIWSKSLGKDLTAFAKEYGADMIIKTSDVHGMLDSVLFTPLDWQLLRHAPVPVFIAQDKIWHPTGTIAVALSLSDPDDMQTRLLNMRLLREAQELSHVTKCEIHLLTAIEPVVPPAAIDLPGFVPEMFGEDALKAGCVSVLSFAARHKIKPEYCHIREGKPDDVIPALCEQLKPTVLFIGTAAREGISVALLGNICERVVDELDCDVAVITPKAVIERIPYATEKDKGVI